MKKVGLVGLIVIVLLVFSSVNVQAAGNHSYLDNDEANTPNGTNTWAGLWDYLTGSKHYRGDARISKSATGAVYIWAWKVNTGPYASSPSVYVYLNDIKFSCSKANYQYYALSGSSQVLYLSKTINQNVAPVGWGYVGIANTGGSKRMSHMSVTSFINESGYMGADGIRITY